MQDLIIMLKLLDLMEKIGLKEYQVESLHNIIMDMLDLNNQDEEKKIKKVLKSVKK